MWNRLLVFITLLIFLLPGCSKKEKKEKNEAHNVIQNQNKSDVTPLIIGYTRESYDIAKYLTQEFSAVHPDKTLRLQEINSEKIDSILKVKVFDALFTSMKLDTTFIQKKLVDEIFLFAVNFDNPVLTKLVQVGLDLPTLKKIISTYEIRNWTQIFKNSTSQPLQVLLPPESEPSHHLLTTFFKTKIYSYHVLSSYDQVRQNLSVTKGGLAFVSLKDVYDLRSGIRKKGVYPLFLDLNGDKFLSDDELFYDQVSHFKKAYLQGKYPDGLVLKHHVYFQKTSTKPELTEFSKFVEDNALNLLEPRGYVKPK